MSEAALKKIQTDCTKLESELTALEKATPINTACEAIIKYINTQPEPFRERLEPSPFSQAGSDGGGCIIS